MAVYDALPPLEVMITSNCILLRSFLFLVVTYLQTSAPSIWNHQFSLDTAAMRILPTISPVFSSISFSWELEMPKGSKLSTVINRNNYPLSGALVRLSAPRRSNKIQSVILKKSNEHKNEIGYVQPAPREQRLPPLKLIQLLLPLIRVNNKRSPDVVFTTD